MDNQSIFQDWNLLTQFLPEGWKEKAKSTGALCRQRKFKSAEDLLRVLLIHLADGCSMRETSVRASQGELANVSSVGLFKRLRNAADWFQWMTTETLNNRGISTIAPEYINDYRVKSVDASVISEPGSTGTDWRLHYSLNLFSLDCNQFIISDQNTGESFKNFQVTPGDLFIGDRAYGRLSGMRHVLDNGGDFIVRLKNKAFTMYNKDGERLCLLREIRSLRVGDIREIAVAASLQKEDSTINLRLIVIRKSAREAERSEKRALQEQRCKQRRINPETIELHRYVILATSLPASIKKEQIAELYRYRWQIEIAFKRLKSILALGHLPKKDKRSCRAWLNGKLFVAQLAQLIMEEGQIFSPWGYPFAW